MTCLGLVHKPRRSLQPKHIDFRLCAAQVGEECPIGCEDMATTELEFLPGVCYDPLKPEHRVAELHCGHRFSAMNLVYHWARSNSIKCPICRDGHPCARLNMRTLPSNFRNAMTRRVRNQQHQDNIEVIEEDRVLAIQMSFVVFVEHGVSYMSFVGLH